MLIQSSFEYLKNTLEVVGAVTWALAGMAYARMGQYTHRAEQSNSKLHCRIHCYIYASANSAPDECMESM